MDDIVISVENLSKKYDLGVIGTGTFSKDLNRWWARLRHKPDPYAKIGEADHGNRLGQTILALDDVSFDVKRGEVLGIIGRNGAGKSTLLKILSQVTAPSSGRVKIKGRIGSLLEVGTGFHPELTGRENLYLNGAILGMSKAEVNRKFDEIVDFSGVEKFIDTPVKRYSSGMYVRLAFAVAAHLEPEILIVDEVLAVGDAEFQKKCLGKMSDVAHEGRTVLFVSHNMAAISNLCTSSIIIDKGCIALKGDTNYVISNYLKNDEIKTSGNFELSDENNTLRVNSLNDSIFKWTNAKIFNSKGVITNLIDINEPFELLLTGNATEPVNDLIVGFGLMSQMGFSLFNSHSVDDNVQQKFSKGEIQFHIRFENNYLAPGLYVIDLGANGSRIIDWIPEAFTLKINELTENGETLGRSNYSGVIIYPCKWRAINKVDLI
jgi:lipopolysaccharide transport system ATP-binding protein